MERKTFGPFSGTHLTVMVCAAILAPSMVVAAVNFTNVAVVNPDTGTTATVDAGGNLHSVDAWAQYRNNPANYVDVLIPMYVVNGCETTSYTAPPGKSLVITGIHGNYSNSNGSPIAGFILYGGANCGGFQFMKAFVPIAPSAGAVAEKAVSYGDGIAITGRSFSLYGYNDNGWTYVTGFLVPQIAPSSAPAAAAVQPVSNGPSALLR